MFSFRSIFLSSLLGFAAAHSTLFPIDFTWTIDGGGNWSVNTNWVPALFAPPNDPSDTATFPNINSAPAFISIPATYAQIQTLTFDSPQPYILVGSGGSIVPSTFTPSENCAFIINNTTGDASHTILAPVDLSSLTKPLQITQNSTSPFTISGQITDPSSVGIVYNGPQTMILNGSNNSFGSLNILAGTVQIGTQTALSGAVTNSGTLQLPAGAQNISSFTQNPSGTLAIDYTSPGSPSQLFMTGAANIDGTLLISTTAGASYPTSPVTIIQANSLEGQFANWTASGPFVPVLNYEPQTVTLTLIPMVNTAQIQTLQIGPPILLGAANQTNLFIQMQQVNLISRIQDNGAFSAPPSDNNESSPLPNLAPWEGIKYQNHSSMLTAYNELSADSLDSRFLAEDDTKKQKEQILVYRTVQGDKKSPGRFYIGPTVNIGKAEGKNYTYNGAQAGADYAFTELGVGGLFSYDQYSIKGLLIDQVNGTLYGTYVPKKMTQMAVSGNFGYTYDWLHYHTRKGLEGDLHTARGTPKGIEFTGLLAFQYFFELGQFKCLRQGLRISPYVSLQYTQIDINGFKEHGAEKFDVEVKRTTSKQLCPTLELFFIYNKDWNNVGIKSLIGVGWQGTLMQSASNIHLRPVDSHGPFTTFKVKKPGNNYAIANGDLQVYFFKKYGIEASWSFEWNKLYYDNEFYLGFSLMF